MTNVQTFERSNVPTWVRLVGRDATAGQVLALAAQREGSPLTVLGAPDAQADDPAQVDPALVITRPAGPVAEPAPGLGYAGFTPEQRFRFLEWLKTPREPAPPAFVQLHVAQLEVALVEGGAQFLPALKELLHMQAAEAWQHNLLVNRALLLAHWLYQVGQSVLFLNVTRRLPDDLLGLSLAWQGLLGERLRAQQIRRIAETWELPAADAPLTLLEERLRSLTASLSAEPLTAALNRLSDEDRQHRPWRCAHRTLRIAIPQPNIRLWLEPQLAELLESVALAAAPAGGGSPGDEVLLKEDGPSYGETLGDGKAAVGWLLILEFGQTRSEYFELVLEYAQRQPGFRQLLDEQRKLVYRVFFRKSEMKRFWRLWDYVQSWTGTHVYVNGRELHKSHVWPYSQYLQ